MSKNFEFALFCPVVSLTVWEVCRIHVYKQHQLSRLILTVDLVCLIAPKLILCNTKSLSRCFKIMLFTNLTSSTPFFLQRPSSQRLEIARVHQIYIDNLSGMLTCTKLTLRISKKRVQMSQNCYIALLLPLVPHACYKECRISVNNKDRYIRLILRINLVCLLEPNLTL